MNYFTVGVENSMKIFTKKIFSGTIAVYGRTQCIGY